MHQQRFLVSERQGHKNVFKISPSVKDLIPSVYDDVKKIIDSTSSKKQDQLAITKSVLEDYNLSLSPRVAETMAVSVIKQKIKENLSQGIRYLNVGPISTVLADLVRFDLYLGNDDKYVAIELKIIETLRGLRERIGTLAILDTGRRQGLAGVVLGYIISPIGGQWFVEEQAITRAIASLNPRNIKLATVVLKADRFQVLDTKFIERFAVQLLLKVKEVLDSVE
jgi:hypothetical protein